MTATPTREELDCFLHTIMWQVSQTASSMVIHILNGVSPFVLPTLFSVPEARQGHGEGQAAASWDRQLRGQGNNQIIEGNEEQEWDLFGGGGDFENELTCKYRLIALGLDQLRNSTEECCEKSCILSKGCGGVL